MNKKIICCILLSVLMSTFILVFALYRNSEVTTDDINGKYFFDTNQESSYYVFSNNGVVRHSKEGVQDYGKYKLIEDKVYFTTDSGTLCYIYEDDSLYPDGAMKGEIPDGDRFETQCEFSLDDGDIKVNSVYKFSTNGTLTIQNKTYAPILGNRNYDEVYYYNRKDNLIEITHSKYNNIEYLYTKDGKLYNRTMVKETE